LNRFSIDLELQRPLKSIFLEAIERKDFDYYIKEGMMVLKKRKKGG